MTRMERVLLALVCVMSVAMPLISVWSFWLGYHTAKEIWRGLVGL